jgi:hypothetical protein
MKNHTVYNDANTPAMSLETKPGECVVFDKPNLGYNEDTEQALKYLVVGQEYKVLIVDVGDCSSVVFLEEVPGVPFNTAHFRNMSNHLAYAPV